MVFRLRDFIFYPAAINRCRTFLDKSQYWSQEKRREWTREQLDRVLWHAVRNVPYYKRTLGPYEPRFREMLDRLDLSELPLITKDLIRKHYQELQANNPGHSRSRESHTSGSSGTPMQFLLDRSSDTNHFAAIWRVLNWTGYKFGNRFACINTTMETETEQLFVYDFKQNCLNFPFVNLKKDNIKKCVTRLKKFNPVVIKSYPSALALFSHWLREVGIRDYRPKAVLTCAETLLDHQKKIISEVLECPIFDFYNQNERACLFSTCGEGRYHIHEEYSFVELLNSESLPAAPGESAEIITTGFHNFVMPLIRYQTNDLAVIDEGNPCECGRTYKTVERVIGRIEDMIVTPRGRHVSRMDIPFKYSPGIQEGQIIQKQVDKIKVNVLKADSYKQKDLDNLLHHMHLRLGEDMKIEYDFVDSIPLGENGKKKFIVSKLNLERPSNA